MKQLKNGQYAPIYFLHGEEAYFIEAIADYIEKNALDDMAKSFNQSILYGKDVDHLAIIDAARRYPVMSERQVVILKEAQSMSKLDELDKYAQHPVNSTILVICYKYGKYDARKKLLKTVTETGLVFESKKLYDNQVPTWISEYLKVQGIGINADAAQLLGEYLGTDLAKVSNELDKLLISLPKGGTVTLQHVQDNIGISKDFNVFELQSALARKDIFKVYQIINYFESNPKENPMIKVIGSLTGFFTQLYMCQFMRDKSEKDQVCALFFPDKTPDSIGGAWQSMAWKLKDFKVALPHYNLAQSERAISALSEYDLKAKGIGNDGTDDGELMRELMYKIMSN